MHDNQDYRIHLVIKATTNDFIVAFLPDVPVSSVYWALNSLERKPPDHLIRRSDQSTADPSEVQSRASGERSWVRDPSPAPTISCLIKPRTHATSLVSLKAHGHDKISGLEEPYTAKEVMMRKSVVLACILSIFISAIVLVGCGGGGSSSETPEQVAKAFFAAYQNKEASTTWNMMSANSQKTAKSKAAWEKFLKESTSPIKFTVGKVTVSGNKATAEVEATVSGQTSTATIPLVKENGVWKVDMTSISTTQ